MSNSTQEGRTQALVFFAGVVSVLVLMGVLGVGGAPTNVVQPDVNTPGDSDPDNLVAILVVDSFEPLRDAAPINVDELAASEDNCLLTPDGLGGWISGLGGWISGLGGWISGLGGWISGLSDWDSGASEVPIPDTHGRIVYHELEALIRQGGGELQSFHLGSELADSTSGSTEWLRDVGRWDMGDSDGDILLAAIDTDQYTSSVIATRIDNTVRLLNRQFGITRFVVNMSFGIVPCEDILTADDYEQFLEADGSTEEFKMQLEDALTALNNVQNGVPLSAETVTFLNSPEAQEFRQSAIDLHKGQFDACYVLDAESVSIAQPGFPDGVPVETLCDAVQPEVDALGQAITTLETLVLDDEAISIYPIAASGNRGDSFSFAPGFWPKVVSVSGYYNQPEFCMAFSATPTSNAGEVIMYGMYDCLWGTSFAAPRLSMEAGIYLLRGGAMQCSGGPVTGAGATTFTSSPPLAYLSTSTLDAAGKPVFEYRFANAKRAEAGELFCEDFNTLVGVP